MVSKGAYILYENKNNIEELLITGNCDSTSECVTCKEYDIIILATGSEVSTCYNVIKELEKDNIFARLISMPCIELFDKQPIEYKKYLLPKEILKISVEAGTTSNWYKYADYCIGIDSFGASGKGSEVMDYFGLSEKKIENEIRTIVFNNKI